MSLRTLSLLLMLCATLHTASCSHNRTGAGEEERRRLYPKPVKHRVVDHSGGQVRVVTAAHAPLEKLSDFEPCGVLCKQVEDESCIDRTLFSPPMTRPDRWMMCVTRCASESCNEAVQKCKSKKYCTHVVVYGNPKARRGAKRPKGDGFDYVGRLMGSRNLTSRVAEGAGAVTTGAAGLTRASRATWIEAPISLTPPPETWSPIAVHSGKAAQKVQVFVFSHRRSGTHLSMSFLQHNFPGAKVKIKSARRRRAVWCRLVSGGGRSGAVARRDTTERSRRSAHELSSRGGPSAAAAAAVRGGGGGAAICETGTAMTERERGVFSAVFVFRASAAPLPASPRA